MYVCVSGLSREESEDKLRVEATGYAQMRYQV